MFKIFSYSFLGLFLAAQLFHSLPVSAEEAPQVELNQSKIVSILCTAMRWLFGILILLSVIMILVAAFMYLTSGGNAEKVGKATKTITYAVVGVAVAILARGVPTLVGAILGVGGNLVAC